MAGGEFQEFGFLLPASPVGDGAAGVEGAARWREEGETGLGMWVLLSGAYETSRCI